MDKQGFSVSEVNQYLKQLLESQSDLHHIPVMGEVSNFKRYASGHCYFTLKDEKSALKCVMFKSSAAHLSFTPRNGEKVVAFGSISVYERDGVYQLYVTAMRRQGIGDLMQAYEALKEKLTKEGLFDDSRKKPLPRLPRAIGIITSPSGAAVHDIITVSRRRNKGVKLILYPVKVQGEEAAGEIVHAIDFFQRNHLADLLIVGRGGGSIEDLWAFNEEPVVRAIAASKIPIISAVGHETDFTLSDFAADARAATPSQAAEFAVIDVAAYRNGIAFYLDKAAKLLEKKIHENAQLADSLQQELAQAMEAVLDAKKHRLSLMAAKLSALSPLTVLSRGYTITTTAGHRAVQCVSDVSVGDTIRTTVADGTISSVVSGIEKERV
ncbi:MAG: exodeoxyribonuclease VII large subunit [Dialister sp.]|nr:exodeoxyribonuclease VII large subunit [Dialister sp.]